MKHLRTVFWMGMAVLDGIGCTTPRPMRFPASSEAYRLELCNISDAHVIVPTGRNSWRLSNDGAEALKDAIRQCEEGRPDLVLLSGDVVEGKFHGMKNLGLARELLSGFQVPWFVVPGNHDARYTNKDPTVDEFDKKAFFRGFAGHGPDGTRGYWSYTVPGKKITLLGIDTSIEGTSFGEVPSAELAWLEDTLASIPGDHLVIPVMHHPTVLFNPVILEGDKTELSHFLLRNHAELRAIFEKYSDRIRFVLSGHTHTPEHLVLNDIHYISTPSINSWPNRFGRFTLKDGELVWRHVPVSKKAWIDEAWLNLSTKSPFLDALKSPEAVKAYFTHGPLEGRIRI